jgi:hypothetical protein
MLKTQHLMHKVRANYSSCTSRSSENIRSSSSGSAHEKGKAGSKPDQTQCGTKCGAFLSLTPSWRLMYFFASLKKNLSRFWGTKLSRLLVPCFPDFTENSIKHQIYKYGDYIIYFLLIYGYWKQRESVIFEFSNLISLFGEISPAQKKKQKNKRLPVPVQDSPAEARTEE